MKKIGFLLWVVQGLAAQAASSPCDLSSDGTVNVADVQLSINQALGQAPCIADLNGDGRCDVVDVQLVITAALGGTCNATASTPGSGKCAVTSPVAGSTQSGVVTWTANVSSLPSAASVDWIFDDFRNIGHVTAAPWSLVNYNTGWDLDGPGNAKIIVHDGMGGVICTSPDVPFITNNFGMTATINAGSSFTSFTGIPTVSGNMTLDISGSFPNDVQNGQRAIDGNSYFDTVSGGDPAMYPTGANRLVYDTTRMMNGLHTFTFETYCGGANANCGSPAATAGANVPKVFVGGVFNVQNGHTLIGPEPDITHLTMVVGGPPCSIGSMSPSGCGSYQLKPVLLYADGTTVNGTFTYAQDNACLFEEIQNPQLPFQCVTGNTHSTLNTSEGANYVIVNPAGLITAMSQGESYITVIDTASGKASRTPIVVTVKALATVPHFGTCGAIYNTYHAGGSCPSTLMTSLFNADTMNPQFQPMLVKAGYTAFEASYYTGGSQGPENFTNFSSWQSSWQRYFGTPISTALTNMPGLSMVMVGTSLFQQPPNIIEVEQGQSASWTGCGFAHCDPLGYVTDQLASTQRMIFHTPRDEAEAGLGGNLYYNYKMVPADGTTRGLVSITVDEAGNATFRTQGPFQMYGGWSRFPSQPVTVIGASSAGLNGSWTTQGTGYYCTEWNAILGTGTRDTNCAANPSYLGTWIATTSGIAPGTYSYATDPNLEVLGWGSRCTNCWTGLEGQTMKNDNYAVAIAKFKSAGIPTGWCTSAGADFVTDLTYQGQPELRDAFCRYISYNGLPTMNWGRSFWETYQVVSAAMFGGYKYSSSPSLGCCQWRGDTRSYSSTAQDIPYVIQAAFGAETFQVGGKRLNISGSISGGILTTTIPHNVVQQNNHPFNTIKVVISGNSDTTVSCPAGSILPCTAGEWYATPTGANTLRLYKPGLTCGNLSGSGSFGSLIIRGVAYPIVGSGGYESQINIASNAPADLMPGELIQISGAGGTNAACNGTYTFASFQGTPNDINLGRIIASTGSGGTILLNDDQGQINPLYDINHYGSSRFGGGGTSANLMLLAGWGVAGIRGYQGSSAVAAEGGWSHFWPDSQDGLGMQSVALGEPNQWLNNQQRWWDIAQGLNFLKRLSPFYLQTPGPAPFIAPGPPWVVTSLTTSAAYGNILNVISFSEAPQTILVPLGSACQIGTNPISVYRASFPYATADLLTGAQGNVSYTLDPGEAIAFACHANGTQSFVKPYTVTYAAPAGTVKTAVQVVYGNYAGPLQQYTRPSAICSASPCNINLDTGASDVYYKLLFMDAKGAVISTVGPINIPKGS